MILLSCSENRTKDNGKGVDCVSFDYNKLRGKIKEKCGTQEVFAKKIGISRTSLSQKLNNSNEFTQQEINNAAEVLDIPLEQISIYFFTPEVQKTEHNSVIGQN